VISLPDRGVSITVSDIFSSSSDHNIGTPIKQQCGFIRQAITLIGFTMFEKRIREIIFIVN